MKKEHLQLIKASVLGLLTLLLLVITVFEILPAGQSVLIAKDEITVSPSRISVGSNTYQLLVSGTLFNDSDETLTVDSLTVRVEEDEKSLDIRIPLSLTLGPRAEHPLSYSMESTEAFERITSVTASVDGEDVAVSETASPAFGTVTLLLLALTLVLGYFCYRSILVYHYTRLERKIKAEA